MTRRALVIASQIEGLQGAEHDAARVASMLGDRGFEVEVRIGERASRDGILAGYDRLITASQPDDVVVVYYSGHGFHAALPEEHGRMLQCIAPTDLRSGAADDWRGITAWELSIKQAQLTARTRNVTVILDACSAAQMSRDPAAPEATARALADPALLGFDHHLAQLRARYGADTDLVNPLGNPDAVRLVACGRTESAFDGVGRDGRHGGVFTDALLAVLAELGDAQPSWAALADAIHARVVRRFPTQHPLAEGPARRRLFSLDEDDGRGVVPVRAVPGGFELSAGALSGVTCGDVYGVMPVGARAYDAAAGLGELAVREVRATTARAVRTRGDAELPVDAVAIPVTRNAPRQPVAVIASGAGAGAASDAASSIAPGDAIAQALAATPTLRCAAPGEPAIATLRVAGDRLTVEDAGGPLFAALRFPDDLPAALGLAGRLGAVAALRALVGAHGIAPLDLELGVVDDGARRALPDHGSVLDTGDRIYLELRPAPRALYLHVFSVGMQGHIRRLSEPLGERLAPGDPPIVIGEGADGVLVGLTLTWPDDLPVEPAPRRDELLVIATAARADLGGLETDGARARGAGSALQDLLAQLHDGEPRGAAALDELGVQQVSWLLRPALPTSISQSAADRDRPLPKMHAH